MIDRPVFVAGLDRSGKTPMRIAIETRAGIAMARRAELWTEHRDRYGDLADDGAARRAVAGLLADRHVARLVNDPDALLDGLLAGPRTYAHLFAMVGRQHAAARGVQRWGDQTAHLEQHAPEILEAFPQATMIHMIRDPRDRFAAAARDGAAGRRGAGGSADEWLSSVELGEAHAAAWPDRYAIVRYEDLARRPESTLRGVLDLIGEPVDGERSLDVPDALPRSVGIGAELSQRALALIEHRCAAMMARYGYAPGLAAPTLTDRLGITLFDRPMAMAAALLRRRRGRGASVASRVGAGR